MSLVKKDAVILTASFFYFGYIDHPAVSRRRYSSQGWPGETDGSGRTADPAIVIPEEAPAKGRLYTSLPSRTRQHLRIYAPSPATAAGVEQLLRGRAA